MPRIEPVTIDQATGKQKELLEAVKGKFGRVPNTLGTLANSPAALQTYLDAGQALGGASLSDAVREQIALAVSGLNRCDYCVAAHTAIAKQAGVDQEEAIRNISGEATDEKVQAALEFAKTIVEKRAWVDESDIRAVRDAGYSDGEIIEIVATVAVATFTNYINHVAQTEVDFPKVEIPAGVGV